MRTDCPAIVRGPCPDTPAYTAPMDPLARHLLAHFCNNAWANHRLLGACAHLTQAEFEAPRVGFFPSIRATLNHLLTVDGSCIDAIERSLRGGPPNPGFMRFFDEFFCSGPGDTARRADGFRAFGSSEAAIWGEPSTGAQSSAGTSGISRPRIA